MYQDKIDLEFLYHYFDSPGLNQQDFREEFAQIRQRFAKFRLKILIDSLTDSADNSATSTPIKKVISALDSPHKGECPPGSNSKQMNATRIRYFN